jgi:hypothetical protein
MHQTVSPTLPSYQRTYDPKSYHIVQEIVRPDSVSSSANRRADQNDPLCSKNTVCRTTARGRNSQFLRPAPSSAEAASHSTTLPDCRFQKAIKKVRATQRLRRSRGFAFSQTESAKDGGRDQERLIRAYDTTLQVRYLTVPLPALASLADSPSTLSPGADGPLTSVPRLDQPCLPRVFMCRPQKPCFLQKGI